MGSGQRRAWRSVAAWVGLAVAVAGPAAAADPAAVTACIAKGRDYLFRQQKDGNWEAFRRRDPSVEGGFEVANGQWGGMTALAALSLLAAGVDATDPHLKSAIAFLRTADLTGNYALGLRAQVWGLIPPEPWVRQAQRADLQALEAGIHATAKGDPAGFYGYLTASPATDYDHSVSQFAVLGMWALNQAGQEVPTNYWQLVDAAWHRQQQPDGGWAYKARPLATDPYSQATDTSMTAAGVATLYITQEYTQLAPRCNGNVDDPAIDAGLRFLGDHLTGIGDDRQYYTLFGVSRVGLASGYKYLGKTDWFDWGSTRLVRDQAPSGAWTNNRHGGENLNGVNDTAFALLFLSRGRVPVMMNKLRYDLEPAGPKARPTPGTWDQRPRDVANLARWVGKQIESQLNWQVVDLHGPADDLHDAPILYMAGGRAPKLSEVDLAKLRAYCEDGGLLLGHADCASSDFARGFKQLGERMFPRYRFRPLDPTSPIFTAETFPRGRWATKPTVDALTNGTRELMVLLPQGDPARQWQAQSFTSAKTDVFGQLVIDLFLYSVEREGLRHRGETYLVDRQERVPNPKPARVARVKYDGNWDPEPGGWRRLANVLHDGQVAELSVQTVDLSAGGTLDPRAVPLASLTVAAADAKLSGAERSALLAYVRAGGTLLIDAAGGRSAYAAAAEAEAHAILPDAPKPLPTLLPDSPVYTAGGPRLAVRSVDYRRFDRDRGALHLPQLRGATVNGRVAVIVSPQDLSVGLVGMPIDGVAGYAPADATKVVTAVIAYAAKLQP